MNNEMATDEVTDSIAHIEMQRQDVEKEAGRAAACSEALRKLHELLARERESLQPHAPDAGRAPNIEAVTAEIDRVKKLADVTRQRGSSRNSRPGQHQAPLRDVSRNPGRNKSRRTMGRSRGR